MTEPRVAPLTQRVNVENWSFKAPFRITGYTMLGVDVVVAD